MSGGIGFQPPDRGVRGETMSRTPLDFVRLRQLAEEAGREFLAHRFEDYLALIRRVQDHPSNRDGSDKSWVEPLARQSRIHHRVVRESTPEARPRG